MVRTMVGAEQLVSSGYAALRGYTRVGVIANPTSLLPATAEHIVDRMAADRALVNISCVFGPEHGFRGDQQDGKGTGSYIDNRTGLQVFNAYGVSGAALAGLVETSKVDALVFDIQDVGSRYYTFVWTLYDFMAACASLRAGFPFVVLDRPNPIGPMLRGPVLKPGFESFVGRAHGIPVTHGMTVGELASLFSGEYVGTGKVTVTTVPLRHWRRSQRFEDTGLPWVLPSPNMPTLETARIYPGTCLLEATSLSEGRGTTRPFSIVGAPFLDWQFGARLRRGSHAAARGERGALYRSAFFTPTFSKHAGNLSAGVDVLITEPATFDPMRTAIEVLVAARGYQGFAWNVADIDRLSGSNYTRLAIDAGASIDAILAEFRSDLASSGFAATRRKHLIETYDGTSHG